MERCPECSDRVNNPGRCQLCEFLYRLVLGIPYFADLQEAYLYRIACRLDAKPRANFGESEEDMA